jgi:hypothetical protein
MLILPDAIGLFDFTGCRLSAFRSIMSLKIYIPEPANEKQTKAANAPEKAMKTSEKPPSSFPPKITAAKTNKFLAQSAGLNNRKYFIFSPFY